MANKSFNARHGISVGPTSLEFIDSTGKIVGGTRISWLTNPTVTTDQPLIDATQTWNSGATPFTGFRINVTDTASNASSKLLDLQKGGVSQFYVDKNGNTVILGDLTVQGTTVTMNTTVVDVEDTNITLGKVTTPTDVTANGGGITLLGTTNKTFSWNSVGANWDSSENISVATGKVYKINNVEVLSATTLGSGVVSSSLTSVGTIGTGVWQGTPIANLYIANPQVTVGTTTIALGASSTTLAGLTSVSSTSFTGALTGNASSATVLQTPRTINGVSFNGSANITVTANTPNVLTRGSYLTGNNFDGSAATTWAVFATITNTANAVVARDASGNFSAGTITATLSGNSSTATTLQTPRTINGTNFDGSANITTSSWGTSRNLTIGNSTKAVDGSAAVSWTLAELGAADLGADNTFSSLNLTLGSGAAGANSTLTLNGNRSTLTNNIGVVSFTNSFNATTFNLSVDGNGLMQWAGSFTSVGSLYTTTGAIGIGTNAPTNVAMQIHSSYTIPGTGVTKYTILSQPIFSSTTTSEANGIYSQIRTQAAAFTIANAFSFRAGAPALGAGSAITNHFMFSALNDTVSTNVYGFNGAVAAGATRYNLYMSGTAKNYLAGTVLIGSTTDNGVDKLQVTGSILASGNITAYSDRRIKTNIMRIENALDKVSRLNGYTFDRTDCVVPRQTGVIAQEVLNVLPEAISGSEETNYSVAYGNMVGLLIEAIKELKAEINQLKGN